MPDRITVKGHNGEFGAYIVQPKKLPAPAVIVLHEVFGVNADIQQTCSEIAEQGFIAVAPEMYWREELNVNLSVTSEADWQHGLRLNQAFDRDAGARDIRDTVILAAKLPGCTGKVAILGYCIGGLMTFLTTARFGADAAVVYHGGDTEKYLDEAHRIDAPLLWHQGRGKTELYLRARTGRNQSGARKMPKCCVLELSGPIPCIFTLPWRAL